MQCMVFGRYMHWYRYWATYDGRRICKNQLFGYSWTGHSHLSNQACPLIFSQWIIQQFKEPKGRYFYDKDTKIFFYSWHFPTLPCRPSVGYKPKHFDNIMKDANPINWLEIHTKNYMDDGGRPLAQFRHLAETFPILLHNIGLSIDSEGQLEKAHLERLKYLCDWLHPANFSEHLAWSTHDSHFSMTCYPCPILKTAWHGSAITLIRCSTHWAAK